MNKDRMVYQAHIAQPNIAPAPARTEARIRGVTEGIERHAPRLLLGAILLWIAVFFVLSWLKYESYGQGYDQVDFEQAIWNTIQGRLFEDSRFSFTNTIVGIDWMPLLAGFVPFYALAPSPHTLFFLQIVAAASGAVPVYGLARDRLGTRRAGLVFGLAWLLYPTVEHVTLQPFQVRVFAAVALLWALYFLEKGRFAWFLGAIIVALLARTDVALVVIMFGAYELFGKRRWPFIVAPVVLGLGYFALVMAVIIPPMIHLPAATCTGPVPLAQIQDKWPGGNNPNTGYYLHWGCTLGQILGNLVTDPLYTLRYMIGGPPPEALVGVPAGADFIAQGSRLGYLAALLVPFSGLALLAPRGLLLSLGILGLNLIAWRSAQVNFRTQYQILITVGVVAASINEFWILDFGFWNSKWRLRLARRLRGAGRNQPENDSISEPSDTLNPKSKIQNPKWHNGLLLVVLAISLLANGWLVHPGISIARAALRPQTWSAAADGNALVALVPRDAKVAASSFVAPHLLPRRYIYNFPPAPYSPPFDQVEYVLVDVNASGLANNPLASGKTALQELVIDSGNFQLLAQRGDYRLYKRIRPGALTILDFGPAHSKIQNPKSKI